jgi:hypothetical protein
VRIQLRRRGSPRATCAAQFGTGVSGVTPAHDAFFTCFPMTDRRDLARYPASLEIAQTRKPKAGFHIIEVLFNPQLYQYDHNIESVSRISVHEKGRRLAFF